MTIYCVLLYVCSDWVNCKKNFFELDSWCKHWSHVNTQTMQVRIYWLVKQDAMPRFYVRQGSIIATR